MREISRTRNIVSSVCEWGRYIYASPWLRDDCDLNPWIRVHILRHLGVSLARRKIAGLMHRTSTDILHNSLHNIIRRGAIYAVSGQTWLKRKSWEKSELEQKFQNYLSSVNSKKYVMSKKVIIQHKYVFTLFVKHICQSCSKHIYYYSYVLM